MKRGLPLINPGGRPRYAYYVAPVIITFYRLVAVIIIEKARRVRKKKKKGEGEGITVVTYTSRGSIEFKT